MPLRVTVDLIPGGVESRAAVIGHYYIVQRRLIDDDLCEYTVADPLDTHETWTVQHRRSEGAWALVAAALAGRPT